jgi:hypothetical protein
MVSRKTSRATKLSKRLYILIQVTGGGDARQAEYAVLTIDAKSVDVLLKRCALTSALQTLDQSFGHASFHGHWCEWLEWSDQLESLLDGKDVAVLTKRPRGKTVAMDSCYVEIWHDGETYFTGYEKSSGGEPVWQAGPVPRETLEECKQRLMLGEL